MRTTNLDARLGMRHLKGILFIHFLLGPNERKIVMLAKWYNHAERGEQNKCSPPGKNCACLFKPNWLAQRAEPKQVSTFPATFLEQCRTSIIACTGGCSSTDTASGQSTGTPLSALCPFSRVPKTKKMNNPVDSGKNQKSGQQESTVRVTENGRVACTSNQLNTTNRVSADNARDERASSRQTQSLTQRGPLDKVQWKQWPINSQ